MELDKNCNNLNNIESLESDLSTAQTLDSNLNSFISVERRYAGVDGDNISVEVDQKAKTISATLKQNKFATMADFPVVGSDRQIYVDLSNKSLWVYDTEAKEYIPVGAKTGDSITFDSVEELVSHLNGATADEISQSESLFVLTIDVPDFWVYKVVETSVPYTYTTDSDLISQIKENGFIQIGHYQISLLETEKVPVASKDTFGTVRVWVEDDYLCISTKPKPKFTYSRVFSENTPEQISAVSDEISKNGYTSAQVSEIYGWNLGDTIPVTLSTGETIEMQIIGLNHDEKSDGSGKAGITLQMVECLTARYPMNSSDTNAGGYAASVMKIQTLPAIKSTLPQEWQNVIKLVDKKSANGGRLNYSETLTTSDDLFLLAEIEVFGATTYAQDGANEGSVYEYWNGKAAADRIKKYDKDADGVPETVTYWWMRSSSYNGTNAFCGVDMYGGAGIASASYSRGVAFGFCV